MIACNSDEKALATSKATSVYGISTTITPHSAFAPRYARNRLRRISKCARPCQLVASLPAAPRPAPRSLSPKPALRRSMKPCGGFPRIVRSCSAMPRVLITPLSSNTHLRTLVALSLASPCKGRVFFTLEQVLGTSFETNAVVFPVSSSVEGRVRATRPPGRPTSRSETVRASPAAGT